MATTKRYFEFVEGTSNKFWEIWVDGSEVYTRYGKIGSDGQTTVKDQGSPDGATTLCDKLVKEKTGKGYAEKGGGGAAPAAGAKAAGYAARWAAIAKTSGPELVAALETEWSFMCDTPKCKPVLSFLLENVKSASASDDKLVVLFDNKKYKCETVVTCSPPATEKVDQWPKSWQTFMKHHDGMKIDSNLDVPIYFNGTGGSGAFEQDYVEEVEPELYEKAQDKEIKFEVPIDLGQDWVVANPFKKNKLGEPALYFFSHEGGGFDDAYPIDLGVTGVFLRLMTKHITGKSFFEKSAAPESDDDDDDDGDDNASTSARRFEFSEDGSNKFWEIRVEDATHTVRFGKIGTDGQTKTKEFESAAAAQKDADKLIAEKTKKGYEEV